VRGALPVEVETIETDRFTLRWERVPDAESCELWLGAEPPGADGKLPGAHRLAKLAGGATRYDITGLFPDMNVFALVSVRRSGSNEPLWGSVHLRLPRGTPTPEGAPRSAHLMAPRVLAVVLRQRDLEYDGRSLIGNRGAEWQAGQWEVAHADGTRVPVLRAMRHSVVAGQGNLPVGFDRHAPATVHLEHRVYLELGSPLESPGLFTLRHRGAPGTELRRLLPVSDRYLETPAIQLNQVGYHPKARQRWAYVSGWLGDGGPLPLAGFPKEAEVLVEPLDRLAERAVAVPGVAIRSRAGDTTDVGAEVRQIDLARVRPAEGVRYRVRVPGVGVSYPTAVSEQASFKAFYTILRGLLHNRWCGDLRSDLTDWSRPADHCSAFFVGGRTEGFFPEKTQRANERALRGGHHDAGDFDIRPLHVLVGQALLRAYELGGPKRFSDGQLHLPESGNGIPDLLDEALWSVAAWEQLQEDDGRVRLGVESVRHPPGYYLAHEDQLPYFAYDATPAHTAYVAGLFAQAAFLVRPFAEKRADHLVQAARRALRYAEAEDAPETYRAYAYSELARAEDRLEHRQGFERLWSAVNVHGRGLFDDMQPFVKIYPGSIYSQHPAMVDFVMAYLTGPAAAPGIRLQGTKEVRRWADEAARRVLESAQPHRGARAPGQRPDWGMDVSQGRYLDGLFQALQLGSLTTVDRARYRDALSLAADAMLGCNPAGMSYVTGLGSRSPEQVLHLDSLALQKTRGLPPIPGLVVYGPVEQMPGSHYYRPLAAGFYPPFGEQPRALRYVDAAHAVNMSEFSVWESQAPAALLFAALLPDGLEPWSELAPGRPEHRSPLAPHRRP
jgi:endoglucanase